MSGLESLPTYLKFRAKPTGFVVRGQGKSPAEGVITFSLRLPFTWSVETSDGRSLREIDWTLDVHEGEFSRAEGHEDVNGLLTYSEAYDDYPSWPEGAGAFFYLAPAAFAGLRDAVLGGRTPDEITLSARGVALGYAPDGSSIVWDIKGKPTLPLVDLKISFGIEADEANEKDAEKPIRAYLREHMEGMASHNSVLARSLSKYLLWIFWALITLLFTLWAR